MKKKKDSQFGIILLVSFFNLNNIPEERVGWLRWVNS